MGRMEKGMKRKRVTLVGCASHKDKYYNAEGYIDPTAGCAIEGSDNIYAAPVIRKPGERGKVIRKTIHPVSEMEKDLATLGIS